MDTSKLRLRAPDILKLLSCCGVVMIHVSAGGVDGYALGSFPWAVSVFWDSLARAAVPVFFMCTGAFMLPPEKELAPSTLWKKYFLRILWILLFWAFVYGVFMHVGTYVMTGYITEGWFLYVVTEVLRFNHHLHLYYLQMLLLLYAALPILRVFTRGASMEETRYALIFWALLGILSPFLRANGLLDFFGGMISFYEINMVWATLGYALLGYYLSSLGFERKNARSCCLLFISGLALTFGGTVISSSLSGELNLSFMEGMSPGPLLMAIGVYGLVHSLYAGLESTPWLARLVKASFCVYLIHHFFVMMLTYLHIDATLFTPVLSVPLFTALVLAASLAGWWVLSKIPFVKDHLI